MQKNKKQFGVWMDTQHATIVGRENVDEGPFVVIDHINNPGFTRDSDENGMHNKEIGLTQKFFKEIAHKMQNVDEIHVTGTGKIQEEFIHYLANTPQYKNADSSDSTSKKMNNDQLVTFITKHFNS